MIQLPIRPIKPFILAAASLACLLAGSSCTNTEESQPREAATLAVMGARVWTGNPEQPWAEAVASRGDTLVAVGSREVVAAWVDEQTEVLEAAGQMLIPGFIDSHVHLLAGGRSFDSIQLRDADTREKFMERIAAFAETRRPE